jgi:hypothetical protein
MRLRWNTHFQEKKIFNFKTYRELITVCQKSFIFFSLLNTLLLTLVLWSKDFRFSEHAQRVARCCLHSMSFTKTPSRMLTNEEREEPGRLRKRRARLVDSEKKTATQRVVCLTDQQASAQVDPVRRWREDGHGLLC